MTPLASGGLAGASLKRLNPKSRQASATIQSASHTKILTLYLAFALRKLMRRMPSAVSVNTSASMRTKCCQHVWAAAHRYLLLERPAVWPACTSSAYHDTALLENGAFPIGNAGTWAVWILDHFSGEVFPGLKQDALPARPNARQVQRRHD